MRHRAPLLAVLAALVLGVGWWFLLYEPLTEDREQVEQDTEQLVAQEAQLRTQIAELERVRDNEMAIRAELSLMEEYIPNGVAQPTALRELQDATDAAGVEINMLAFGSPVAIEDAPETGEADTTLAQIGVTMTVEGGYFQLVDLLRRLEVDVPRAVLVENLTVGEGREDEFPTLEATWSGRVFAVVDIASTVAPEDGEPLTPDDPDADDADPDADDADADDADADDPELDELDEDGATT